MRFKYLHIIQTIIIIIQLFACINFYNKYHMARDRFFHCSNQKENMYEEYSYALQQVFRDIDQAQTIFPDKEIEFCYEESDKIIRWQIKLDNELFSDDMHLGFHPYKENTHSKCYILK